MGAECGKPTVQAGTDGFCTQPEGHDGSCVTVSDQGVVTETTGGPVSDEKLMREALLSIQSHGMTDDNAASMVWTARVGLNPDAIDHAPEHLRSVIRDRFAALADEGETGDD